MRLKLQQLKADIERAKQAPLHNKIRAAEKAVSTAASLCADLVQAHEQLSARMDTIERGRVA